MYTCNNARTHHSPCSKRTSLACRKTTITIYFSENNVHGKEKETYCIWQLSDGKGGAGVEVGVWSKLSK